MNNAFVLFVLGKGEPDKALNYDAKMRCEATIEILRASCDWPVKVYFVGGKPERKEDVPVSAQMKQYFDGLMGCNYISEAIYRSNNLFGNIQEIIDIAGRKNHFWILANDYQLPRCVRIFSRLGIKKNQVISISAEERLKHDPQRVQEIAKYRNSLKYKLRIVLEKLLTFWMFFDPEYKIITVWRKIRRRYL